MASSSAQGEEGAEGRPVGLWESCAQAAGWLGPWVATAALALWTSSPATSALALAALGVTAAALWGPPGRGISWGVGSSVLIVAIVVGFAGHRQVDRTLADFDAYWAARDTTVGRLFGEELDRRLASGEAATTALTDAWMENPGGLGVGVVRDLRARYGSSALALYDANGVLVLWDGVHRGQVPEAVQRGEEGISYHDLPLFGHLYITSKAEDGSTALAVFLLRSDLPEGLAANVGDFVSNFYRDTGERIRITEDDPGEWPGIIWDLEDPSGQERYLSAVVERPDPEARATEMMNRWRAWVGALTVAGWMLLAVGGPRRRAGAAVAAGALVLLAAWLPFEEIAPLASLFAPGGFHLPGPIPGSLGRFTLVVVTTFALVSVLPRPRFTIPAWSAGAIVGAAFPLLIAWTWSGPADASLSAGRLEWVVYESGVAALLALVTGVAFALTRRSGGRVFEAVGAVALSILLGAGGALWVSSTAAYPGWWPLLWGLPAALAAHSVGAWSGWRRSVAGWILGIVVAGTAAIPATWSRRVEARMLAGERRLAELTAPEIPELEASLRRFGMLADSLYRAGSDEVSLLYDGWRLSGLAAQGHPVWLLISRRDGSPGEELRLGVEGEPDVLLPLLMEGWREGGVRLHTLNRDDARYILTATLPNEEVVSVVAAPFVETVDRSALGPLLRGANVSAEEDPLSVIPLLEVEEAGHPTEVPAWVRTESGWQADIALEFANGTRYHAHYLVTLPSGILAMARATLLLVLSLALFFGFWLIGQGLSREIGRGDLRLSRFVISFRARVTLALFGFFTLANALFGTVAYRTLSQASRRSAQVIAERVGEDAAGWYRALRGQIGRLAQQVGAELLEYRDGELREGSVEPLVELGLYEGWTPYSVAERLSRREVVYAFDESSLGRWEYVTAYRRLPNGDILAAQVPLQAGMSALQTTDLVELLGFLVLVGAALSLGLAMLAGRALTRPIRALQAASESVGAGDLGLRLPPHRGDEFGAVFEAFNRMVGRVRRARRQLVRTSRRTQLIMDEAAVGMVALDPAGRVTLVNPRAEELLGGEVQVGGPMPGEGPLAEALSPWLDHYLRGSLEETDAELQAGDRRVRVRARRLGSFGTQRGVVVALDDVTDELRAERVLAWGEMARQVAHEVKNPLTPIKLSIQHVRRAWEDRHPEFETILLRNADAMLSEIERLAGIAQSFSNFGAPGDNAAPLARVSVEEVVSDVMALYGGSAARVRFSHDVEPGLPPVVARTSELKEVLVNLLENARLAGKEGTLVSIVGRRAGPDTVLLSVVDNGSGIPEDILPRVFEPQFSTRSKGTGLGLAIVQRLVRAWGGSVSVESELGRGTVVMLEIPVWRDAVRGTPGTEGPESAS